MIGKNLFLTIGITLSVFTFFSCSDSGSGAANIALVQSELPSDYIVKKKGFTKDLKELPELIKPEECYKVVIKNDKNDVTIEQRIVICSNPKFIPNAAEFQFAIARAKDALVNIHGCSNIGEYCKAATIRSPYTGTDYYLISFSKGNAWIQFSAYGKGMDYRILMDLARIAEGKIEVLESKQSSSNKLVIPKLGTA